MHQAGLIDFAQRKAMQTKNPCSINAIYAKHKYHQKHNPDKFTLQDFRAAFLLLGLGFGCAIVALSIELLTKKIIK